MKLKKIVSLALAGILAVSMLAGCGDNSSNNNEVVVPTPSTSIVDALNNGQSASNTVKVTFTSDSELQDALETAIAMNGTATLSVTQIKNLMPEDFATALWTVNSYPNSGTGKNLDIDGESATILNLINVTGANTEKAALNKAAADVDKVVAGLVEKSKDEAGNTSITTGKKYYVFDYEGAAAMVSVKMNDGTTKYFVAYTLTQTATEKKAA